MYELTINTDTFFLTSSFYYDKACEHPCPTIVPLVQGLAGTLRVHFVGELAPEASDSCLFAIRPYRGVDDLYRTEYATGQVDEDGDVYFDIDLNVSTAELVGALTGREVLDVKAGFVVVNEDQSSRREFQSASTISKTVLAQNETAPLPRATAQSEADYYAGKYVSEWLWGGEFQSELTSTISEYVVPIEVNIQNLCSTVVQIDKNYEALASDMATGFANAKTCREQLASEVYACIGSTVETIASTYATKEELTCVDNKTAENKTAIEEEVTRATNAETSLEISIKANASNIEANASAIASETTRATEAEEELKNSISENASAIDILEKQQSADETAIQTNASDIANLQAQLATDETAISQNASAISDLQSASANYVTLEGTQTISGDKTFAGKIGVGTNASISQTCGAAANLYGCWLLRDSRVATISDIPDVSGFATTDSLNAEISNRESADATLQTSIDANASAIADETTRATGAESCLQSQITKIESGDAGLTNYYTKSEVDEKVTGLTGDIETNTTNIATNTANIEALQGSLANYATVEALNNEISNRTSAESDLQYSIDQNASSISAIENCLYKVAQTEISLTNCVKTIGTEITNLTACVNSNTSAIAELQSQAATYVTLSGEQTITGQKAFTMWPRFDAGIHFDCGCSVRIERNSSSSYGCLHGTWKYKCYELATTNDIPASPDLSNYVTTSCLAEEIEHRESSDSDLNDSINSVSKALCTVGSDVTALKSESSNYVTLTGNQTISGQKTFSSALTLNNRIHFDTCDIRIGKNSTSNYGCLSGTWRYKCYELATLNDIPNTSDYVTMSTLTTGQITVQGEWHFDGEVQMSNNGYLIDLQEGVLAGTWKLDGKTIATVDDIPDSSSFVTLDSAQTITAQKTFSSDAYFTSSIAIGSSTEIRIRAESGSAGLYGSWKKCGGELATLNDIPDLSNFVTLCGGQTISGQKTFTNWTCFSGTAVIASKAYIGSCSTTMARNSGGDYVCLTGTWRLKGADLVTRDISDALDARITALEAKVG